MGRTGVDEVEREREIGEDVCIDTDVKCTLDAVAIADLYHARRLLSSCDGLS